VHKIVDGYGNVKYASHGYEGCDVNCSHHRHNHLHFTCNNCGNIYCICSIEVPMVNLPEGYSLQTLKLSAEGICDLCTKPKIAENC
jgi:Fur family ferric uptake transcriptional regulator